MVRRGVSREMLTPLIYMKLSRHDRQVCYWRLKLLLPAHPEPSPLSFRSLRCVMQSPSPCHSERSEESSFIAQGRLREKSVRLNYLTNGWCCSKNKRCA